MFIRKNLSQNLFLTITTFLFLPTLIAHAQSDLRPVSIDSKTCTPRQEICGSGIDEDCDGVDLKCPGDDGDRDGFPASQDCDDGDKFVYPGVSVACKTGCGDGVKTCNAGGYTTCTCTPLCEKLAGGRCFYVDPVKGNDSNSGSFQSPLKTLLRFATYYDGTPLPSNKIDMVPGDVIYLKSGNYNHSYLPGGEKHVIKLLGVNGTSSAPIWFKAYPGNHPIMHLPGDVKAISVINSNWLGIQGITIDHSNQEGIWIAESSNIELRNVIVRNTDGLDNENLSGVKLTKCTDINLHHSILHDNYDRTNADTGGHKTENSRNMVIFSGKNIRVNYSTLYQSPETSATKTGACLSYKHGPEFADSYFEVGYNLFSNCFASAIGMPGHGGRFHHNLFINSDVGVYFHVYGQTHAPSMKNNIVEFNTSVNTPLIDAQFKEVLEFHGEIGLNTIRNNIITDNSSYDAFKGIYTIDPYGQDSTMNEVKNVPYISSNNNCFYNSNQSIIFAYYSSSNGENSSSGGVYDFSEWKDLGFDLNSLEVDPLLSPAIFSPQNDLCANKGIYAN